jgi:SNF2 family DNA or RNA helicase
MKARLEKDRILVSDHEEWHNSVIGAIPGARKVRIYNEWSLPDSPFSAIRLYKWAKDNNITLEHDGAFTKLIEEYQAIKESQKWKTGAGRQTWKDILDRPKVMEIAVPTATTPWIHQGCALSFINNKRAWYLAMEMGTGKTLVTIMHILENSLKRVLILCPKSVLQVWADEWAKHAPNHSYDILVLDSGTSKKKAEIVKLKFAVANSGGRKIIIVTNYDSARQEALAEELLAHRYDLVVLDEAHKTKAPGGVTSRFCARLGKNAKVRGCLSGTPLPNNLLDSYAQFRFLDPGLFGTNYARMRNSYAIMGGFDNREVVGFRNVERFERLFGYLTFRVDKDVLDLPPVTTMYSYCDMSPGAAKIYKELKREFITQVKSGEVTASNALVQLLKFQQLTGGFIITDEGATDGIDTRKSDLLAECLDSIDRGEQVVVFCRFKHDLEQVCRVAKSLWRPYGELSGDQNDLQGGQIPGSVAVLGVQIQAGGLGVNLSAARYAIFYSVGFSLADYLQACARVHRGGQTRPVTLIHLLSKGTVDEKIYQALSDKREVIDSILEAIKQGGEV